MQNENMIFDPHFDIEDGEKAIFADSDQDFTARSSEDDHALGGVEYTFAPLANPIHAEFHQYEFADKYTRGLCTIYGPIGAASTTVGRAWTEAERLELAKLRYEAPDFDQENGGGYSAVGVNIMRKWWNEKNPTRKLKTIAVRADSKACLDGLKAGYRAVWGYRGNKSYGADFQADASLDNAEWGKSTYGHCLSQAMVDGMQSAIDNYAGRQGVGGIDTNIYRLPVWSEMVKNRNVHETVHFFVWEDSMTDSQRWRFEAKKIGLWNAEREGSSATRYECAIMIERACNIMKTAGITDIRSDYWNGQNANLAVKRNEMILMTDRAIGKISPSFTWEDMKAPATRGECAEAVCKALYERIGKKL